MSLVAQTDTTLTRLLEAFPVSKCSSKFRYVMLMVSSRIACYRRLPLVASAALSDATF